MSPGVGMFRAVRLPPARKMAMSSGALPEISRLMTSWRVWRSGVCRGTSATSIRCCIGRQEGPAAVNLGNDLRMSIRLTSGGDLESVLDGRAMAGQALLGCVVMSSMARAILCVALTVCCNTLIIRMLGQMVFLSVSHEMVCTLVMYAILTSLHNAIIHLSM